MPSITTTYLLGAGASAEAIPCVKDLAAEIDKVFKFISKANPALVPIEIFDGHKLVVSGKEINENWHRLQDLQLHTLKILSENLSIDTIAKIYYGFDQDDKYWQLKAVLVAAFLYWESKDVVDKRYSNFWATLMAVRKADYAEYSFQKFQGDINIISWNYDNQLEMSLKKVVSESKWEVHQNIPKEIFENRNSDINPKVFKLNGSARLNPTVKLINGTGPTMEEQYPFMLSLAAVILFPERFPSISNLCYSWETTSTAKNDIQLATDACEGTEVLIVIGYSFPSLNHAVDSVILNNMRRLRKVYFQGRDKADSMRIMDYFTAVSNKDVKLIPIESPGFFIPPEVTVELVVNYENVRSQNGGKGRASKYWENIDTSSYWDRLD